MRHFQDRTEAGHLLASQLMGFAYRPEVRVLALPRGGVPVAYEVAQALGVLLDVLVVRKLGVPDQPELAMGAVTDKLCVLNSTIIQELEIADSTIQVVIEQERQELARRDRHYRGDRPPIMVHNCIVILVDDGLATGATMRVAVAALRQQQPERIVVAVPVGSVSACEALAQEVDELYCLKMPDPFHAVGASYQFFPQTADQEVCDLLNQSDQNLRNFSENPAWTSCAAASY